MRHIRQAVVFAGGKAERLGDICKNTPKCLLRVGRKVMLDHILTKLAEGGYNRVVLCVNHFGEQVEAFVGSGAAWGIKVQYAWDREDQPPKCGADLLLPLIPMLDSQFSVTYGDCFLHVNYGRVWDELAGWDSSVGSVYSGYRWGPSCNLDANMRVLDGWWGGFGRGAGYDWVEAGLYAVRRRVLEDANYEHRGLVLECKREPVEIGTPERLRSAIERMKEI